MVIARVQKLEKIKIFIDFGLYKAQMVQNQKVYMQSTPSFARVFLVTKKSIVTHISFKIKILINCINR